MNPLPHWSLLILGEALCRPVTRASEFATNLRIAPEELEATLDDLVRSQLLDLVAGTHDSDLQYMLTAKGRDLWDVIDALDARRMRWSTPVPSPAALAVSSDQVSARPGLIEISVLGAFALRLSGEPVLGLSVGSQRLLVFLALQGHSLRRLAVAGAMWPEVSEERAGVSLRAALSRLDAVSRDAILVASSGLGLAGGVRVDLHEAQRIARRLVASDSPIGSYDLTVEALSLLSQELLPDWYDDWVIGEGEDWRQLRMNALEALALVHHEAKRYGEAAAAARAAIKVEPLRETSHAILIGVHLAKGNQSEALRAYDRYCELLHTALGLAPTKQFTDLISSTRTSPPGEFRASRTIPATTS